MSQSLSWGDLISLLKFCTSQVAAFCGERAEIYNLRWRANKSKLGVSFSL